MDGYDFETRPVANADAVVKGDKWRISVLTDGLVRLEFAEDGQFEDRASTFAINRDLPVPKFRVNDEKDVVNIITDRFHLTYDRNPFSPNGLTINVLGKVTDHKSRWRYPEFDESLGGTARTLDDVDGRCELGPGIPSTHGYSALDDSSSMLFEGKNWVGSRRPGHREDIYVFTYGMDFRAAMKTFYALSGKQPEVPRWCLGNWWSRYHAYSDREYLELMDHFEKFQIPLSVAVLDMDWHIVDDPRVTHSGWTGYTWNKSLFPDPATFLDKLRSRNLKITANDHPAEGVHAFEDVYQSMAKEMGFDTSHKDPIQFDCTSPAFMKAYLNMWHSLGFDFCWIDWQQGTESLLGFDPMWLLNHYHHLDNRRRNGTPMIFSRYAGPGSHRYPVGFSGDSHITWESLHFQPEFTATASNIGFGQWSHDLGGHMFGNRDDEMAARWIQLGVFSPLTRLHSTQNKWMSKEPWIYSKEAEAAITDVMRFRHRLIPYLYTMNVRAATDDEPLVQPVYWHHPTRREAYLYKNTFFFGSELFVAPITSPRCPKTGLAGVKAWLPPGDRRWVDIFTGQVYDGDRTITFWRPLDQTPVLAREGSIIPLDANQIPPNGAHNPESFEVLVVPGADAEFVLVEDPEDDGPSQERSTSKEKRRTKLTWSQKEGKMTSSTLSGSPWDRPSTVNIIGVAANRTATALSYSDADGLGRKLAEKDPNNGRASLILPGTGEHSADHPLQPRDTTAGTRLARILNGYQIEFEVKDRLWDAATGSKPLAARVSEVLQVEGACDEVLGPVLEVLLADCRE